MIKNLPANAGDERDTCMIPGSRSSEVGNGNPIYNSCLDNSMDRGSLWAVVHGITELDMTERLSTHMARKN